MPAFICTTCGTQYPPSDQPPAHCVICEEERQYVVPAGQSWTTQEKLAITHVNAWREHEPNVLRIITHPTFAIGQGAILLRTPAGNVLWDCITMLDAATIAIIKSLGGVQAMGISHPHFYSTMVEWSRAFDVPVHLHADDRQWVMRPDDAIRFWEGETLSLLPGVTMIRCGGHFTGSCVLHWEGGADGRGILLTSDTAMVATDRKFFSFMRSYPNVLPLPARAVDGIAKALAPFRYDRAYGLWSDRFVDKAADRIMAASVARYIEAIRG